MCRLVVAWVLPVKSLQPTRLPLQLEGVINNCPCRFDLIHVEEPVYFVTFATRDSRSIPSLFVLSLLHGKYARCAIVPFNWRLRDT